MYAHPTLQASSFNDASNVDESQEILQNIFLSIFFFGQSCHYSIVEVRLCSDRFPCILPPLATTVQCTRRPRHTKAVQAITHHGLS